MRHAFAQTARDFNRSRQEVATADKTKAFLSELTALSCKYGIAIAGEPPLFVMEREDLDSAYHAGEEGNLSFG